MTDEAGTFNYELRIEASPEVVFAYFTDPAKMARWMGIDHKLDPVPGGVFRVDDPAPVRSSRPTGWTERPACPRLGALPGPPGHRLDRR